MKNHFFWAACVYALFLIACNDAKPVEETAQQVASDSTGAVAPAEFADPSYGAIVKTGLANFAKGDVAAWMESYAYNAIYAWNNGDSLAGVWRGALAPRHSEIAPDQRQKLCVRPR